MASTGKQLICPQCEKVMASPEDQPEAMRRTSGAWVTLA